MSSPGHFASSTISATSPRRIPKSQFTYRQLGQLKSYIPTTPLRVIAHVDLDAFYAQCETRRLGIDPSIPLAVQQWQGLIAINYPARAHGLTRHITPNEARKLCPDIVLQHVATWKLGDEKWAYHPEQPPDIATHKSCLDPYRIEGIKIRKCIKEVLPEGLQRVEKASIDEVYLDLSALVHSVLLERYPELRGPPPYDDPSEYLPKPPTTVLDWAADALVETGLQDGEDRDPDWDDVCLVIASEIVRDVRRAVFEKLGYTCSAGVARNKLLAKLGSGYRKPNQQTVIRNRAVPHFLGGMKFTKMPGLGGKIGERVVQMFGTDTVKDLLEQPLEQMRKLGDGTGTWIYELIRGEDNKEVNPKPDVGSLLSAKSFRPFINKFEHGVKWLRILVHDIFSRCVEEGVLENKRRPTTMVLAFKQRSRKDAESKSCAIPQGKQLSEEMLFNLATTLFAKFVNHGGAWPCTNLSLSVKNMADGVKGNKDISGFLVQGGKAAAGAGSNLDSSEPSQNRQKQRKLVNFFGRNAEEKKDIDAARAVLKAHRETAKREESMVEDVGDEDGGDDEELQDERLAEGAESSDDDSDSFEPVQRHSTLGHKRPRSEECRGDERPSSIRRLSSIEEAKFERTGSYPSPSPRLSSHHVYYDDPPPSTQPSSRTEAPSETTTRPYSPLSHQSLPRGTFEKPPPEPLQQQSFDRPPPTLPRTNTAETETFFCDRCNAHLPLGEQAEHADFHFAMDLSKQLRSEERSNTSTVQRESPPEQPRRGRGRPPGGGKDGKKGQAKLAFGRAR
jgi:DNA polymerase eta